MVNASGSANSLRVKVLFRRFVIRHYISSHHDMVKRYGISVS